MDKFNNIVENLFYYREREFDSSSMIFQAFAKLPRDIQESTLKQLNEDYGDE